LNGRRFEVSWGSEAMSSEEQFPGNISILEVLGSDDTKSAIEIDLVIQRRLPEPSLFAEVPMMTGPGFLCAALRD
jgi:hypothetical protein